MTESTPPAWPDRPALFLDLDGTLVEIVEHPDRAAASPRLRSLLPRLPEATGGAVALISGRKIEELDRILAPHVYVAAGVHGLQRRVGDRGIEVLDSGQLLGQARDRLESFAAAHAGVWLEDKEVALALHYRSRPELEPEVHRFAGALQLELPPDVEILLGNMVCEIKSGVMDKGRAIDAFMDEPTFTGRTPVFVGDDVTDEAGFRAVNARGGVSVKVGAGRTVARWRLADVQSVLAWLEQVVDSTIPGR